MVELLLTGPVKVWPWLCKLCPCHFFLLLVIFVYMFLMVETLHLTFYCVCMFFFSLVIVVCRFLYLLPWFLLILCKSSFHACVVFWICIFIIHVWDLLGICQRQWVACFSLLAFMIFFGVFFSYVGKRILSS